MQIENPFIIQKMKFILLIAILTYCSNSFSQTRLEYGDFIQTNDNIKWAAETDALLNLMPKTAKYSLKNLYLKKLKDSGIISYQINSDRYSVTQVKLTFNQFNTRKFDSTANANISNDSYAAISETKETEIASRYSFCICDSCSRNELFEIFKTKQVVCYGNADLFIKNILISPLCLKRNSSIGKPVWDILFNVAFSNGDEIKYNKQDLLYLGDEEYYYDFNETSFIENKNKLTPRSPTLINLILDDCKKGKLKLFDPEKGIEIPYAKLKFWGQDKIAVIVYDADGEGKGEIGRTRYIRRERNFDSLNTFKIKQQLYFDKKNEILISVVQRIDILEPVITSQGVYLGNYARFRFFPKNKLKLTD